MPVYIAAVSVQASSHDYSPLWTALEGAGATCLMDATWLIDVSQDLSAVTNALLSHCAKGDKVFVMEFVAGTAWTGTGLDADAKAWLVRRMGVVKPDGTALAAGRARTRTKAKLAINA